MAVKKGGLGRGLDALFNDNSVKNEGAVSVRINDIEPNRDQPRRDFDEQSLSELADSIALHGLLQPIAVRPNSDGNYTIIAGERRWRASRMAGLDKVPVLIKEVDEKELKDLALIENLQREDLNPIEEAKGYKLLIEEYGLTQEQVAEEMGKSRPAIANTLRLLALPEDLLKLVEEGTLSAGHARAILGAPTQAMQRQAAKQVIAHGLSVRQTESLVKALQKQPAEKKAANDEIALYLGELEKSLSSNLGRKVTISHHGKKGKIQLEYYNPEDLEALLSLLNTLHGEEPNSYEE